MKHYVAYHNEDEREFTLGYGLYFESTKGQQIIPGSYVWTINGKKDSKGKKCYTLLGCYIIDDVYEEILGKGNYIIEGESGIDFNPPIELKGFTWFSGFLKRQGNFGFGFNSITNEEDIKNLEELKKLETQKKGKQTTNEFAETSDLPTLSESLRVGAGFGDSESNREVEKAAILFVNDFYKSKGWNVKSVELEKCGYDLECVRNKVQEHVEVKGIKGSIASFIITSREVKEAKSNPNFVICIVTSVLSTPKLLKFTGKEFISKFQLEPLAFKATLYK